MLVAMSSWLPASGVGSMNPPAEPPLGDDPPAPEPPLPPPPPDVVESLSDEVLAPVPPEVSVEEDSGPQACRSPPARTNEIHSLYELMFSIISDSGPLARKNSAPMCSS